MAYSGLLNNLCFSLSNSLYETDMSQNNNFHSGFNQFKTKLLYDFQDRNTCEKEQVVSPDSSKTYKIAAFYLQTVNNLYSQLYKHNFILTDVES